MSNFYPFSFRRYRTIRWCFFLLIGLLPLLAQGQSGTVFRDFNANGTQDSPSTAPATGEVGVPGVVVTAYGTGGPKSATTAADGSYGISGMSGTVRLEFTNLPIGDYDGAVSSNGTSVQFVAASATGVKLGINYPSDFCQNNPDMVTPCYVNGDPLKAGNNLADEPAFVKLAYTASGEFPTETKVGTASAMGSTWGVAYQRETKKLFSAAFIKRHVGLGPLGTSGIYITDPNSNTTTTFLSLSAIGINAGTDPHTGLPGDKSEPSTDPVSYSLIGKVGLGDIDISDDGKFLFVTNLANKTLYRIFINNPAQVPTSSDKTAYPMPTNDPLCATGDCVPFGLKYYRGRVYLGITATAESSQDTSKLKGLIYELDLSSGNFTKVLTIPFSYQKGWTDRGGDLDGGGGTFARQRYWWPWANKTLKSELFTYSASDEQYRYYPQPWVSDIEFDVDGSMIIGIMDRFGHQFGNQNDWPDASVTGTYTGFGGGQLLRAEPNGTAWKLEKNGTSGGVTTAGAGNDQGPGGGEYYYDHVVSCCHDDLSFGGLALLPGSGEIGMTALDPTGTLWSGGVGWYSNQTGEKTDAAMIYVGANLPSFGKSSGLGDLEILCNPAPIQIGNRVWNDTNNNGTQDAGEPALAGIAVILKGPGLPPAGTTVTTGSNGEYYFSNATGTNTTGFVYSLTGLTSGSSYSLCFPLTSSTLTLSSKANSAPGSNADAIDTDASSAGVISFTLGDSGQNNFSYDAGYAPAALCAISATATPGSCNSATNQYTVSGTISLTGNTSGGVATITDGARSMTVSVGASATSVAYSLTGLTSGATTHTVSVSLTGCGMASMTYAAPASCTGAPVCSIVLTPTVSGCYNTTAGSRATVSVEVAWALAPAGQNIIVTGPTGSVPATRTIIPGSYTSAGGSGTIVTPQVVAFEIPANAATGLTASARFATTASCSAISTPFAAPMACPPTACTSGQTGGTVFNDFDADGAKDPGAVSGIPAVTVKAIACDGTIYTTTTDIFGQYTFSGSNAIPANQYPVRIEFSNLPVSVGQGTRNGTNGRTTVQFINSATCSVDLGVLDNNDYCQQAAKIVVPCFTYGDPLPAGSASGLIDALVMFDYGTSGPKDMTKITTIAFSRQVGTVWGVAYDKFRKKTYTSATVKRHAGMGPLGLGGIYMTDMVSLSTTPWISVTALGVNVGSIPANGTGGRGLQTNPALPSADPDSFTAIGRVGIGDLEISEDGRYLYFTNLFDQKLYKLDITGATPTLVGSYAIPGVCSGGASRPFGLKVYSGKVYIGSVCDAFTSQNKSNLRAAVQRFDPALTTFTSIFDFPLTYPKGAPVNNAANGNITGWYPWTDDFNVINTNTPASGATPTEFRLIYPQPVFTDIEFDSDGSMILGFGDRTGLQTGFRNYNLQGSGNFSGVSGGDVLRASFNGTSYVLENNAKAGASIGYGPGNNQGPGFGEFYNDDFYNQNSILTHSEIAFGALALKSGSGQVIITGMDPVDRNATGTNNSGGIRYLSNTTGFSPAGSAQGFVLYNSNDEANTFAKATGLGDLEVTCDLPTYLEIGNRVWIDDDKDGIQDPCEKALSGILVSLYQGTTRIASTTTTATGEYYFNNNPVSSTVAGTFSSTLIQPNTAYTVRFGTDGTTNQYDNATQILTTSIGKFKLTQTFSTAPTANTLNDSNAQLSGGVLSASVTTGALGSVNHTIDAGFICAPTTVASVSATKATCTGATANNNGRVDLTGIVCSDKAFLVTAGSAIPSYTATGSQVVSNSAVSFTGLTNPTSASGQSYSVVLYNGPCCYTVVSALLPQALCSLTCVVQATATPTVCNSATNQYTVNGTIDLQNNTVGGTAMITDGARSMTVSVGASATSVAYSLTGLTSGATTHTVSVSLTGCGTAMATYSAPASCTGVVSCCTNILTNGGFESGNFTSSTTFAGLPAVSTTGLSMPEWQGFDDGGFWFRYPTNNKAIWLKEAASNSSAANCGRYEIPVSTCWQIGHVYQVCLTVGAFDPTNSAGGSTTFVAEMESPFRSLYSQTLSTNGATNNTISSLNLTTVCFNFTLLSGNNKFYVSVAKGASTNPTIGVVMDNVVIINKTACPTCSLIATATPTICNSATNQYTVSGTISLTNAVAGTATVTDGTRSTTVTVAAGATAVAYSLTGLTSGTGSHTVTVTLAGCGTASVTYSAPASCTAAPTVLAVVVGTPVCNSATNSYTATGTVSLTNAPAGSLTITDNGTTVAVVSVTAGQTSASFSVSGASGSSPATRTVVASLSATTASTTYATPASCTACSLSITTAMLANGQVGTAYSQTIAATGGTGSLIFTSTGNLPVGLNLNAATGVISGTPTSATTASFTIQVTDGKNCSAVAPLTITTSAQPVCSLTATATPGVCSSINNTYSVTGTVSATNVGANSPQTLTVSVNGTRTVVTLTGNGPVSYTLSGLTSDGLTKTVSVVSSATACGMASVTYAAPASCTVAALKASLGDYVWLDNNKNGVQDDGATGVQNVTVVLCDAASGSTISTTLTDGNGAYLFPNLNPDSYRVKFTAPAGMTFTTPLAGTSTATDSNVNSITGQTGSTAPVSLSAGENNLTIDAGLVPVGTPILKLRKLVSKPKAKVGEVVSYTLVLTNTGTVAATNQVVSDTIAGGLSIVPGSINASIGSFSSTGQTGTWTIPSLPANATATLTYSASITTSGTLYNRARIRGFDNPDDEATVCTTIPLEVCKNEPFAFELSAPAGYNRYQWYLTTPNGTSLVSDVTATSATAATAGNYTATVAGEYVVRINDGVQGSCPDGSCCPIIIEEVEVPSYTVVSKQPTCVGSTPQANGQLTLTNLTSGTSTAQYVYAISSGSSFTGTIPATPSNALVPSNGVIASSLAQGTYTVRVWVLIEGVPGCPKDVTVTLVANCNCPEEVCLPITIRKTKSQGRNLP